jgi:acetyl esterase/lipase
MRRVALLCLGGLVSLTASTLNASEMDEPGSVAGAIRYACTGPKCLAEPAETRPTKRTYELHELPYYRTVETGLDNLCDSSSIRFSPDGEWLAVIRDHIGRRPPSAGYRVGDGVVLARVSCLFGMEPERCQQVRLDSPAGIKAVWFSRLGETLFVSDGGGQRLSAWSLPVLWSGSGEPNLGVKLVHGADRSVGFDVEGNLPRAPIFQIEGEAPTPNLDTEAARLERSLRQATALTPEGFLLERVALNPTGFYGAAYQNPEDLSLWVAGPSMARPWRTRYARPYWSHVDIYQDREGLTIATGTGAIEHVKSAGARKSYWNLAGQAAAHPIHGYAVALYSETSFRPRSMTPTPRLGSNGAGIWRYATGPQKQRAVWIELPPLKGARIHFQAGRHDAAFECLQDQGRPGPDDVARKFIELPGSAGGVPARLYSPGKVQRGLAIYMGGGPAANLDYDGSSIIGQLVDMGYSVLAPVYAGSASRDWRRNQALSQHGFAAINDDAEAIARWVSKQTNQPVLFIGNSYGAAYYRPLVERGVVGRAVLVGPWLKWREPSEWLTSVGDIRTRELAYGARRQKTVFGVAASDSAGSLKQRIQLTSSDCERSPPTLVLMGEHDRISRPEDVAACASNPRWKINVLGGAGHAGLWRESDAELLKFLRGDVSTGR